MTNLEPTLPLRADFETLKADPFAIVVGGNGIGYVEFETQKLGNFLILNATDLRCMLEHVERREAKIDG